MTETNPECFHLSASAIGSFKACPTRFRLAYREGLRQAKDTDAQRVGSNWHALHESYQVAYVEEVDRLNAEVDAGHGGDDMIPERAHEYALNVAIEHLNERYEVVPNHKTAEEWALEREVLLVSFLGYLWYYQEDPIEPLASEVAFDLPLHMPRTGLPLPLSKVVRVGKIDTVIRWQGMVGNREMKSTSRSIAPESDYWDKAKKDTQVSMYALAFRDMLSQGLDKYGIRLREGDRFGNTLYDVWHKPTIKPTSLTQKDTAALVETGEYCGTPFQVEVANERVEGEGKEAVKTADVTVNGVAAGVVPGRRGYAIRETIDMFGARLLDDIYERPEFYYQRKEIARTDQEIKRFRVELFNIYQAMRTFDDTGCWFENEQQCRATFNCQYIPICYGSGADAVCDGKTTPNGFKRIFDVTVEGQPLEEE